MKTLSITMEEILLKELDHVIREEKLAGRSEAIREAVRGWLRRSSLKKKIKAEIEGYRKKPIKEDEFSSLMASQEFPS